MKQQTHTRRIAFATNSYERLSVKGGIGSRLQPGFLISEKPG